MQDFALESVLTCAGPGCTSLVCQQIFSSSGHSPSLPNPHLLLVPVHLIVLQYQHTPLLLYHRNRLLATHHCYYEKINIKRNAVKSIWASILFFMVLKHISVFKGGTPTMTWLVLVCNLPTPWKNEDILFYHFTWVLQILGYNVKN